MAKLVGEVGAVDHAGPAESCGAFLDRCLPKATILRELSPTTVREHKRTIEKIIKRTLGSIDLRKLDAGMLNDLYVSLRTRERRLSASSVRRVHAVISAALAQAMKEDKLASNPADRATPPSVRQAPKVATSPGEVQAMIASADKM